MDNRKVIYGLIAVAAIITVYSLYNRGGCKITAYQERLCELKEKLEAGYYEDEQHKADMKAEIAQLEKKLNGQIVNLKCA